MDIYQLNDEAYVLHLCDYVLQKEASKQHKFDFLLGDPGKNGRCRKLPVDAYYKDLNLVIEYKELQHYEPVAFFDKPQKMTISGVPRGDQRKLYDNRRKDMLQKYGITLIDISYSSFEYDSRKRIIRNLWNDVAIVRAILIAYIIDEQDKTEPKKVFSRNRNIDHMAFMNWRIEPSDYILNMKNMADGFLLSGIELANACLTDNRHKKADILIFPIFHNINHGIELYLKSLIWTLNLKLGNLENFEGTHDISKLYKTLSDKINSATETSINLSRQDFETATKNLSHYIAEIFEKMNHKDKKARTDFPRYPFDLKFQDQFYVLENGVIEIDLENILVRFTIINHQLGLLFSHLYYSEHAPSSN